MSALITKNGKVSGMDDFSTHLLQRSPNAHKLGFRIRLWGICLAFKPQRCRRNVCIGRFHRRRRGAVLSAAASGSPPPYAQPRYAVPPLPPPGAIYDPRDDGYDAPVGGPYVPYPPPPAARAYPGSYNGLPPQPAPTFESFQRPPADISGGPGSEDVTGTVRTPTYAPRRAGGVGGGRGRRPPVRRSSRSRTSTARSRTPRRLAGAAHENGDPKGPVVIAQVDPITLGILRSPGECGVDVAVGEGQALGNRLDFGGPSFGLFAAREEYLRRMPGRIAGETVDVDGRRGFVLTLQTREQHIRREKATSNICTSQALNALGGVVYLSWLGRRGIVELGELLAARTHYARETLAALPGVERLHEAPVVREFALRLDADVADVLFRRRPAASAPSTPAPTCRH